MKQEEGTVEMRNERAMSYCELAQLNPVHKVYHDTQYGFPLCEDAALFERLALEINQAGLSWLTILRKKDAFYQAFEGFDLDRVATYDEADLARLLADTSIIRNRLKVNAVIENARRLSAIRNRYGSFASWLNQYHPLPIEEWQKLFKKSFVFTGDEIVREFLISAGYLPGAHDLSCPIYEKIATMSPPWLQIDRQVRGVQTSLD